MPDIKVYVILVSNIHGSYMIVGAGAGAKRYPKVVGNYKLQLFDDTCEGNDPVLIYKHVERDIFLYNATDRWIVGDKENNIFLVRDTPTNTHVPPSDGWSFLVNTSTKGTYFLNDSSILSWKVVSIV